MWRKIGRIFEPTGSDWIAGHAQNPMPQVVGDGLFRIHFASRDRQNRARGGYFEFDINDPLRTLCVSPQPTLDLGELGAFDDAGVMPSALVERAGELWLYYTGWSKTVDVPFAFHIGMAKSTDGGKTFERFSRAPVLGRNRYDPFITGAPHVLVEDSTFRMWYISATKWERTSDAKPKHYYTVKHAMSSDGIVWQTSDHLCIEYRPDEYAVARPVVFRSDRGYVMWFTFRGGSDLYRVGTAESADGISWTRDEEPLGIDVSGSGWDSEMICYAYPLEYDGRRYALYNGNGYGATGVGLAVWEP